MPRKPTARRSATRSSSGPRAGSDRQTRRTVEELATALEGLLEEGIGSYDDMSEAGRRRMMELNAGFAAGETLLARVQQRASGGHPGQEVDALAAVIRYILHWAGEAGTLDEPKETLAAMRRARRALERAAPSTAASIPRSARRRRGGAA